MNTIQNKINCNMYETLKRMNQMKLSKLMNKSYQVIHVFN